MTSVRLVSRAWGGCRRVATRRTRVSLESGFFVCAVRRSGVGITRRARIHSHTKLRSRCLPLRCIASIGPRMDFRIYPRSRTVRVRSRARGEATEGTRAMRTRWSTATRGDCESCGLSPRERRRSAIGRSGVDVCVEGFVCDRFGVAASACERRVGVGTSAIRRN